MQIDTTITAEPNDTVGCNVISEAIVPFCHRIPIGNQRISALCVELRDALDTVRFCNSNGGQMPCMSTFLPARRETSPRILLRLHFK